METALRWIMWGFVILGFLIAYFAIRGWTVDLNKYVGIVVSAVGGYFITVVMRGYVASGGSLRTTAVVAAVLLALAGLGRPQFLRDLFDKAWASARPDASATRPPGPAAENN